MVAFKNYRGPVRVMRWEFQIGASAKHRKDAKTNGREYHIVVKYGRRTCENLSESGKLRAKSVQLKAVNDAQHQHGRAVHCGAKQDQKVILVIDSRAYVPFPCSMNLKALRLTLGHKLLNERTALEHLICHEQLCNKSQLTGCGILKGRETGMFKLRGRGQLSADEPMHR